MSTTELAATPEDAALDPSIEVIDLTRADLYLNRHLSLLAFNERVLAQAVLRLIGSKSRIVFKPLPEDDSRQRRPDITLAASKLGWSPRVEREEGLGRIIDYFRRTLA